MLHDLNQRLLDLLFMLMTWDTSAVGPFDPSMDK